MGKLSYFPFQIHKIERAIITNSEQFTFHGVSQNEYHENKDSTESVQIAGIFHESFTNVTINNADDARVKRMPTPAILVLTQDSMPSIDWTVSCYGKKYKVIDSKDLSNLGIATEICLEELI